MATPRPKTFRAVRDFRIAGEAFAEGDVVPPGIALATALKFDDRFVVAESRRRQSDQPNSEEAD
jgi:hypothetical protein